ncbi:hypothetical protein NE237_030421 [Protea cynaroides]|uniref:Uncharacterized protein n=1 Tax=Protea cynaroides TaxID=273540 RepID=A0A9Q0GXT3_9MAGN|nr:hypothetical protein NE237_030421 [Protea cynaroides]
MNLLVFAVVVHAVSSHVGVGDEIDGASGGNFGRSCSSGVAEGSAFSQEDEDDSVVIGGRSQNGLHRQGYGKFFLEGQHMTNMGRSLIFPCEEMGSKVSNLEENHGRLCDVVPVKRMSTIGSDEPSTIHTGCAGFSKGGLGDDVISRCAIDRSNLSKRLECRDNPVWTYPLSHVLYVEESPVALALEAEVFSVFRFVKEGGQATTVISRSDLGCSSNIWIDVEDSNSAQNSSELNLCGNPGSGIGFY